MTLKKTLSFFLALTLVLGMLAPCGGLLEAKAQTTLYGDNLEQVTEPVIGESYYLAASTGEEMIYFRHGSVTETAPYSLATSRSINHNWVVKVTLEDSTLTDEKEAGYFQFTYLNPSNGNTSRIYCYDAAGKDGVMDTGANSVNYKNRHSFIVDDIDGLKVLRKIGNESVLVAKEMEFSRKVTDAEGNSTVQTGTEWRILGVPVEELANEGVHPVMLLTEHNHSYGEPTVDAASNTVSRTCDCGQVQTVYDQKVQRVNNPVVGNQYYLTANVDGTIRYFIHGTVTETSPASLRTSDNLEHNWAFPVSIEAPVEGDKGFQMTYVNPNNASVRIYCYDSIGSDGVADTGANSKSELDKHTFTIDGGYIKNLGNDHVLVVKEMAFTRKVKDADGNETVQEGTELRILGVPAEELANEGVYPVFLTEKHTHIAYGETYQISDKGHAPICWCGGYATPVAHAYGDVTTNDTSNTHSRTCTVCGYTNVVYGDAAEQVFYPVIDGNYYLAANVAGTLKYFTKDGSVTATAPYSLSTTERKAIATTVTLEDSTKTSEKFEGGFQFAFDNNGNLTRIYCMDQLKDATVAGQTGIMDTGMNSTTAYKNRHSFFIDEVNGVKVLRKYGNNNILVVKLNETTNTYRMLGVPEAELANTGVYPVVLLDSHEHTYGAWSFDTENGTQTRACVVCGYSETLYGTNSKVYQAEEAVIGESYYLVGNVAGTLKYFTKDGSVTATAPYSLSTTERTAIATLVTLEDSKLTSEKFEGGFQFAFDNNGNLTRIYCMDVLKDATTAGQTGIMDTGMNSTTAYKNRHSFFIDEVNGVKVLRKYGNNNILVVKLNETTNTYRMLGVTEAEFANEGVYPVMLATAHTHTFGEEVYGDATGHWNLCDCGSKSAIQKHTVESWTVITPPTATEPGSKSGVCTICGETAIVETPVTVNSWNIVLGDNIGVNFVLALTEGDTVAVTVDGEEVPATLTDNGNGSYTVFIKLAAAQMTDEIVISVNGYAVEKTYSVRAYADEILAGDYTSYTKALVQNMLVYGGAAQTYFGHNADNLASDGIEVTAAEPEAAPELVVLNELANVKYYGASLLHKEKTAVRFYFTADSVEGLTFMVDGNVYEAANKDGLYYIEVAGINPQDLDDVLNVVVTDGTSNLAVQYSPLIYISRMYNKAGTSTALVQAMYGYHLAAKAYLANLNLSDDFALQSQSASTLYEGVTLYKNIYVAAGYGEVEAYVIAIDADANVELKVSAGAWDETNNADNPAEAKTVATHFRSVKNAGYNVLAMINGGFFDLNNTKSYLPYGAQIVDGVVKQAPSTDNSYSDNWFGMTTDGKYVISNAAGYADYEGNVQQAVGGGKLLIVDGVPVDLTSDRAYRTAVGVNANGDLVMVAVADATYSDVCHIFVDMGLDIVTVLNLDGGGSTAMYVPGAYYPKALILGDDGVFPREVADAVAIVEKK